MPANCGWGEAAGTLAGAVEVDLERHIREGDSPVHDTAGTGSLLSSESRVVWECSPKVGGKTPSKAEYRHETDSEQVP